MTNSNYPTRPKKSRGIPRTDLPMNISTETLYTALNTEESSEISRSSPPHLHHPKGSVGLKSVCMAGTHVPAIAEMQSWIEGRNGSIFWCCGMAGAEKSSLMATLHQLLARQASEHPQIEEKRNAIKERP